MQGNIVRSYTKKYPSQKIKDYQFKNCLFPQTEGLCDGNTLLLRKKHTHIRKHIPHSLRLTAFLLNIEHVISIAVYISS